MSQAKTDQATPRGVAVQREVRPAAWMRADLAKAMADDEREAWILSGHGLIVADYTQPLYDQAALDAAVAAESERCAAIALRWGETHADGETVNARNAASKIARAIEGPNAELSGARTTMKEAADAVARPLE